MKKIMFLVFVLVASLSLKAQDMKFNLGVGGVLGSLSNSSGGDSKFGFGAEVQGTLSLTESIEGFAQTGYSSYSSNGISCGYIPFLVGAKYKVSNFKFGLGIGYGSISVASYSYTKDVPNAYGGYSNQTFNVPSQSSSGFSFSPQVGYKITDKLEALAHFTSTSVTIGSYNIIGVKVFYTIL